MVKEENDPLKEYHDEMLRTFARGVAHNFNNILTAGMGFLALAMDLTKDHEVLTLLRNVELCHQRITYLSRQLLSFTGDEHLNLTDVPIYNVLRNSVNLFDSIALKHHAVMICDFAPVRDVLVQVDEFRLLQVMVQLLKNAAEALHQGRGRITFKAFEQQNEVLIQIIDTGAGIAAEELPKIFAPFYTSKQVVGVGLGLSMTRTMIEGFGGKLELKSTPEAGTTVTIRLPVRQYEALGVLPANKRDGSLRKGLRALVAVDADQTRLALEAVLLSHDFRVNAVDSEEEMLSALQRKGREPYDVILVDLLHSDSFGDDMVALVRRHSKAPLLALYTTQQEVPTPGEGVAALSKPFDPGELMRALRGFESLLADSSEEAE